MGSTDSDEPRRLRRWLAPRLLAWFRLHRRDLPWRRDRDAYRVWVSEVMLQQTLVATVVPYFERFVARYPTLADLAAADEQDVLHLWQGLGYYRRARHLLQAARELHAKFGGFPSEVESLRGVPGMGDYTRNAVLSQAFGLRLPILEANTVRLLSRLFGREDDATGGAARRWLWGAAEAILPTRDVGDFNQALMELGALVCTPERPACDECPAKARCSAFASGRPEDFPRRPPPKELVDVSEAAVVIRRDGRVLLCRRRTDAPRWGGLWEFPHGELVEGESHPAAAARVAREFAGVEVRVGAELTTIRHGVTRFRIAMTCFEAEWAAGAFASPLYDRADWVLPAALGDYPVSSPQRRLAARLGDGGR